MKFTRILPAFALLALLAIPARAADYAIDPVHSFSLFRIRHMNTSWVWGRFNGPTGAVSYDPAALEKTTFSVTLKAAAIDTANQQRDNDLKSPNFFNAKEFPTITFTSTSVKKIDDTTLEVTGDLALHGVTKPLTTKVDISGHGTNMTGTFIVGFETTFTIKRSEFGMTQMPTGVGDEVRVTVALEVDKK